ncbi:MAG: hypothetical protein RL158_125 [Bacteroidota bacterium]
MGINSGFQKLKSPTLKQQLERCSKVLFDKKNHITARQLGFNKLHELSNKGDKRWKEYFNKNGKVFLKIRSVNESMCDRILFQKSIKKFIGPNVPLPVKEKKVKRSYIKGGVGGKVLGFNFYVQRNGKLLKRERKILLMKGSDYIEEVRSLFKNILMLDGLDNTLTDDENIDNWNRFYEQYGGMILDFKQKFEKEVSQSFEKEMKKYEREFDGYDNKKEFTPLKLKFEINKKKPPVDMG